MHMHMHIHVHRTWTMLRQQKLSFPTMNAHMHINICFHFHTTQSTISFKNRKLIRRTMCKRRKKRLSTVSECKRFKDFYTYTHRSHVYSCVGTHFVCTNHCEQTWDSVCTLSYHHRHFLFWQSETQAADIRALVFVNVSTWQKRTRRETILHWENWQKNEASRGAAAVQTK
jgi:hypothetical protein